MYRYLGLIAIHTRRSLYLPCLKMYRKHPLVPFAASSSCSSVRLPSSAATPLTEEGSGEEGGSPLPRKRPFITAQCKVSLGDSEYLSDALVSGVSNVLNGQLGQPGETRKRSSICGIDD